MKFTISTKGHNDIIDITDKVAEIVKKSQTKEGIVLVFVPHQTCAISVLEKESEAGEKIIKIGRYGQMSTLRGEKEGNQCNDH